MKNETKRLSLATSIVASSIALASPAFAEGEVVFASWGGSFQDALRSAMLLVTMLAASDSLFVSFFMSDSPLVVVSLVGAFICGHRLPIRIEFR